MPTKFHAGIIKRTIFAVQTFTRPHYNNDSDSNDSDRNYKIEKRQQKITSY